VLSKADLLTHEELETKLSELSKATGKKVIPLSVIDDALLKSFSDTLAQHLQGMKSA
jgi:putative ribosome biogenesis GTPase RsgA